MAGRCTLPTTAAPACTTFACTSTMARIRTICRAEISARPTPFSSTPTRIMHTNGRRRVNGRRADAAGKGALQLHPVELAVQGLSFDPEDLGGLALVAAGRGKHAPDLLLFGIGQRLYRFVARFHHGERIAHGLG